MYLLLRTRPSDHALWQATYILPDLSEGRVKVPPLGGGDETGVLGGGGRSSFRVSEDRLTTWPLDGFEESRDLGERGRRHVFRLSGDGPTTTPLDGSDEHRHPGELGRLRPRRKQPHRGDRGPFSRFLFRLSGDGLTTSPPNGLEQTGRLGESGER